MKRWSCAILLSLLFTLPAVGAEGDFYAFGKIPSQHEGRIKPLDTFARTHLLAFNGKESAGELSPSHWLAELLFDPEAAYKREIFNLPNPDVTAALGLDRRDGNRFSFNELFSRLREQEAFFQALREKESESRTPAQTQLLELDVKAARFFEISRSLSMLLPIFHLTDQEVAQEIGLANGERYSYSQLLRSREALQKKARSGNLQAIDFTQRFGAVEGWGIPDVLRIFPPQFRSGDLWGSPWRVMQEGDGSPAVAASLLRLRVMADAYRSENWSAFAAEASKLGEGAGAEIQVEFLYNKWKLFQKAIAFYIGSLLLLMASWLVWRKRLRRTAFIVLCSGTVLHILGIAMRMYVMGRPPVSTLFESVLFVGAIVTFSACILEYMKKSGLGVLIGSVAGSALLFVSFGYAAEGDTMGVLVAVLNTNFWLATHVVCITIGYGICIVGAVLGHVYLLSAWAGRARKKLEELFRSMMGVSVVALLFTAVGTILGGIWADQSWGRFWGWDPKENGALLIVLWLLFVMHGRLSGILQGPGFALCMVLMNVIVAVAWFGVNLLNIGLHSYGFTENIALNLFLFCAGEVVFGFVTFHFAKLRLAAAGPERSAHFSETVADSK